MTNIKPPTLFALALACGLGGGSALAADTVDGHTYHVTVRSSLGTQFEDCFAFASGKLTIQGLGLPEIYRHDDLNTQPPAWQATLISAGPQGFILSFHGTTAGFNGQVINGDGINNSGDTFIFQGVAVPSCTLPATPRANPYKE